MVKSSRRNRVVIVSALVLTLSGIALAAAAGAAKPAEDPLKLIPADSMFCIRINNLNAALGQTDMFLTGLFPAGVSMPVKTMLAQLLGSPEPVGVNMSGSFVVFGPLAEANNVDISRVGILVPVTDYSKFATGNPNVKPANAQGISQISAQQGEATALVTQVGSYALAGVGGTDQTLLAMKKTMTATATGLAATVDAAELKRAQNSAIWAYLNVPAVAKKYGPMLKSTFEGIKGAVSAVQGQNATGQAQTKMAMDMYSSVLDSLMNETRFVSLTLDPNTAAVRLAVTVAALPNTQMADTFKGTTAKLDPKMLGYFRDGCAMNFAFSLDPAKWTKLNTMYMDMIVKFMGKDLSPENTAALKKMTADSSAALGGTVVGSFGVDPQNKPPFNIRYVATLKDQAKLNQVLDDAVKALSPGGALANMYKDMGIKMTASLKRKVANYKGVDIDTMKFSMTATDANSPESKALASMYGSGMTIQMASVNGFLVYAMGGDPNAGVRELIDQVKAGGPSQLSAQTQSALPLIPGADKGSMFATINVLRLMQMVTAISPTPMPIPQTPMASQSDIALAGNCGDGKMVLEIALPKQHVMEIMGIVMQMQMQQQQQPQQDQPQPQQQNQPQRRGGRSTL